MFNTLLIDKLVLVHVNKGRSISKSTIFKYNGILENILVDYFENTHFKVIKQYNFLKIVLYPTYYGHAYHNLEMPTIEEFLQLLTQIKNACRLCNFHVSEIHLTKDCIMQHRNELYIKALANIKQRYKPIVYESVTTIREDKETPPYQIPYKSLSLVPLKHDLSELDFNSSNKAKFLKIYDKQAQLKAKKKLKRLLFRNPVAEISIDEIENLLRLEYAFKGKSIIDKFYKKPLTLELMIKKLNDNTLMGELEQIFSRHVSNLIRLEPTKTDRNKLSEAIKKINFASLMPIGYLQEMSAMFASLGADSNNRVVKEGANNEPAREYIEEIIDKFITYISSVNTSHLTPQ